MDAENRFVRLIAPLQGRMFNVMWRVLRHSQDAEDALQNALTAIWKKREQIEGHAAPQALILRICADAALDQFRRRRRDNRLGWEAIESGLSSTDAGPLDGLLRQEILETIMAGIARLSPNQATAIVMRYMEGESHATIAAAMGCGIETVREHLVRGRKRLGELLRSNAPAAPKT